MQRYDLRGTNTIMVGDTAIEIILKEGIKNREAKRLPGIEILRINIIWQQLPSFSCCSPFP